MTGWFLVFGGFALMVTMIIKFACPYLSKNSSSFKRQNAKYEGLLRECAENKTYKKEYHQFLVSLKNHQNKLLEFWKDSKPLPAFLRSLTQESCHLFQIEEAGVWFYDQEKKSLQCAEGFHTSAQRHHQGDTYSTEPYQKYFRYLEDRRLVVLSSKEIPPCAEIFQKERLIPRNIRFRIDIPLRQNHEIIGFFTLENSSTPSNWSPINEILAGSLADKIVLSLETSERLRAERILDKTENIYRAAIQAAQCVPYKFDYSSNEFTFLGEAIHSLTGFNQKELTYSIWKGLKISEDKKETSALSSKDASNLVHNFRAAYPIHDRSGKMRWISDAWVHTFDSLGNPVGAIGIFQEITYQKQIQESLLQSETRYKAILETQTELICRWKPDGILTFVNRAFSEYFKQPEPTLLDTNLIQLILPEDRDYFLKYLGQLSKLAPSSSPIAHERRFLLENKELRWHQWTDQFLFNEKGVLQEIQSVSIDITKRLQLESDLRDSEFRNRRFAEVASEGIAFVDQGKVVEANAALASLFDYSVREIVDQSPLKLLTPSCRDLFHKTLISGYENPLEFVGLKKDGSHFPLEIVAKSVPSHGRLATVILLRDISSRKEIEESLRNQTQAIIHAQEAERSRVARELHDSINQILSSAKFRLHHLQETLKNTPFEEADHLQTTKSLLDKAIHEIRAISHNLRPSELDDLGLIPTLRGAIDPFRQRTSIAVDLLPNNLPNRLPPDMELTFFRIIQEALTNTERHAKNATKMSIEFDYSEGIIRLSIKDNGEGFSPHSSSPGLGLLNMQDRAAFLSGDFVIDSAPGRGAHILIKVPYLMKQTKRATESNHTSS